MRGCSPRPPSRPVWRPRPHELPWLAVGLLLILAIFLYALVHILGVLIMKRFALLTALGAAAVMLASCGTTATAVLNNVNESCDRHYDGSISAGMTGANFTGTFKADCHAADGRTKPAAPPPAADAPPAA